MLEGKRVLLRPVKRSDINYFLKWFNDPEVTQYLMIFLPMTEMAEEKWIEDLANNPGNKINLVIEALDQGENKPIGNIGFVNIIQKDRVAELGIAIGEKDYWSKGYGTEAAQLLIRYGFEQVNLHRINSSVFAFNERSLKLHRKLGFQEEGRQRKTHFRNGQYWDRVMFGLLREEWEPNK